MMKEHIQRIQDCTITSLCRLVLNESSLATLNTFSYTARDVHLLIQF